MDSFKILAHTYKPYQAFQHGVKLTLAQLGKMIGLSFITLGGLHGHRLLACLLQEFPLGDPLKNLFWAL